MSYSFNVTRTFAASPEAVYDTWAVREKFAQWFGTDAIEVPLDTLVYSPEEGASWSGQMVLPDGNVMNWTGEFVTVDRPNHFVMTITDQPEDPARGTLDVHFDAVDGGTTMSMTQSGPEMAEAQIEMTIVGYNAFFDVIERLVTS